jgi:radical SAM-linked protein
MEPIKQHFRITYKKGEELRYTATLDMHKIWERYFRRANIPLAYSKGFHPQPRINQAMPLPLGMLSEFEYLDFWTEVENHSFPLSLVKSKLQQTFQPGIEVLNIMEITTKQKSLPSMVESVKYEAIQFFLPEGESKPKSITDFLSQEKITRIRRKKEYDLKPRILSLSSGKSNGQLQYKMHLTALPGFSGRPDEVLLALGHDPNHFRITRTEIALIND